MSFWAQTYHCLGPGGKFFLCPVMLVIQKSINWVSEASPTLRCSIEISRDILYMCMYVFDCLWENNTKKLYVKMQGRNYIVQTRACSKISLRF